MGKRHPGQGPEPSLTAEEQLRAVLDNMTDVFFRTDREARLVMASRSIETLLGAPRARFLGRDVREQYVDPDQRRHFIDLIDSNGGRLSGFDLHLRRADGSTVWVEASARRLSDAEGGGLEGILRDVSDRRRAERQAQESRALVQALLNGTTDASLLMDADCTLRACNQVFADRFGGSIDRIIGGDLFALFPPEVGANRRKVCMEVLRTGRPVELRDTRHGRYFLNTITRVPNPDGDGHMVAVFSRDVTDEVEAQESIGSYVKAVERSNAELEQFAYVASHDLREPLRQIATYVSLLERRYAPGLDQDARDFIAFARDGAQRMDALILDLLAFSRITRQETPFAPTALAEAVAGALANVGTGDASVTVAVDASIMVKGDAGQLTRLFQNLLGNALKYRSPERMPRVRIGAETAAPWVRVAVEDNGIGIEPVYFERIFRIFQRLHGTGTYDGTGIGLAICKRVAENHGGAIAVDSVPGQGSTFTVTLPLA
jgi:PAS domain S-box/PAS domain S-box